MNDEPARGAKTGTRTYPFPLELVAQVATALLVHGKASPTLEGARDDAADLAVRVLEACEKRLLSDKAIKEAEQQKQQNYDSTYGKRQRAVELLREKYGDAVPWKNAIFHATSETQLSRALPRYKRYLLYRQKNAYEHAERVVKFDRLVVVPPEPTEATVLEEIQRKQKERFTPEETVNEQVALGVWYEKFGRLESRREGGKIRAQKKSAWKTSKG